MALTKYVTQPVPATGDLRKYLDTEFRKVKSSADSIIDTTTSLSEAVALAQADADAAQAAATTAQNDITAHKANVNWTAFVTGDFMNSWGQYDGVNWPAMYRKDKHGVVHLSGLIGGGTRTAGTAVIQMPSGYWPLEHQLLFTLSYSTADAAYRPGRIDINKNNGRILVQDALTDSSFAGTATLGNTWVSLFGIHYYVGV